MPVIRSISTRCTPKLVLHPSASLCVPLLICLSQFNLPQRVETSLPMKERDLLPSHLVTSLPETSLPETSPPETSPPETNLPVTSLLETNHLVKMIVQTRTLLLEMVVPLTTGQMRTGHRTLVLKL